MPKHPTPIKVVNSVCPIRINDFGGWTDTWFAEYGEVLNLGVYPYVQCQMRVLPQTQAAEDRVTINAINYGDQYRINPDNIIYDKHPLLEAAIDLMKLPPDLAFEVSIMSSVPGGCSTGTSAAVSVALIGALDRTTYGRMTPAEVAMKAHEIETVYLKQQCGIQDQICAAYGGILHIQMFKYPHAQVSYLEISNPIRWEMETRLSLIFLGETHKSSEVHEWVIRRLEGSGPADPSLCKLRAMAQKAKNAIYEADLKMLGRVMIENTGAQAELHEKLLSPVARQTIEIAKKHGAIGWKINGAGGDGGSLTLLSPPDWAQRRRMVRAIEEQGGGVREIPIYLSRTGLRVWETPAAELNGGAE
ncbi:MAG: GHMP kinase [bacterium]|nr:GHMP kinase [bacterium]